MSGAWNDCTWGDIFNVEDVFTDLNVEMVAESLWEIKVEHIVIVYEIFGCDIVNVANAGTRPVYL